MRNGNLDQNNGELLTSLLRSYPTYEEWKHGLVEAGVIENDGVPILPMRNGNISLYTLKIAMSMFLSYL